MFALIGWRTGRRQLAATEDPGVARHAQGAASTIVDVDDRAGGTLRMPGNPWIFSSCELPPPGAPAYQGEHNEEILTGLQIPEDRIRDLEGRNIILNRR